MHKTFGPILNNHITNNSIIERNSASALWLCQLVHLSQSYRPPNSYRVTFSDSFYTRPRLAEKLFQISDGDIKMTGTCKYTNMDAINRPVILECVKKLEDQPRGTWLLGRSYSFSKEYDKNRKKSNDEAIRTYKNIPGSMIQSNSGFIFFKDAKVVVFYTNDLKETPYARICEGENARAIRAVHGVVDIERWTGGETVGRSRIKCPAIIVSYQFFMNGVDRVDQLRSTNPIKRKEQKIHMSLWTYCFDLCIHQAYCIYSCLMDQKKIKEGSSYDLNYFSDIESNSDNFEYMDDVNNGSEDSDNQGKKVSFYEFKRRCCEQMVTPFLNSKAKNEVSRETAPVDYTHNDLSCHILLPNVELNGNKQLICYLCNLIHGKTNTRRSYYGCIQCSKGFHVSCFAAFHRRDELIGPTARIRNIINAVETVHEN